MRDQPFNIKYADRKAHTPPTKELSTWRLSCNDKKTALLMHQTSLPLFLSLS
jgi:hypothetical protein